MITVQVFGEDELLEHLADRKLVGTHLISITDPGLTTLPEFGASFDSVLRLQFLDLESEEEAQEDSRFLVTEAQICEIVEYYNEHKGAERWTVHCWQGISRSTAVALGLMVLGGKTEADAWETLRAIRPQASPNRLVLEYWDRVTGSRFASQKKIPPPWKILLVNDEDGVHFVHKLVIKNGFPIFRGRPLEITSAYSAQEGLEILRKDGEYELIIMDTVMERTDSGRTLIRQLRRELGLTRPRIIYRNGSEPADPVFLTEFDVHANIHPTEQTVAVSRELYLSALAAYR